MNLDATVISISLIATGVATCILLGNPQMDKRFPTGESSLEKSLPSQLPTLVTHEHAYEKLDKLESEIANLRRQMDMLEKRMAEKNGKLPAAGSVNGLEQEAIGYAGPHE